MADTYTSNLGLTKPGYDSPVDVGVLNDNMDKIDNAVANAGKVKSINGKTPDGSGAVTLTPGDLGAATAEEVSSLKGDKANKADVLSLEEIQASTDLSGKIASASAIKTAIDNINSNLGRIRVFFSNTHNGSDSVTFGPVRISGTRRAGLLIGNANSNTFFDYITVTTVNTNEWKCANHLITGVFTDDYTFTITIEGVSAWGNYWLLMFD